MKTKYISLCTALLCATSILATTAETYDCLHLYRNVYDRVTLSTVEFFPTGRVEFSNFLKHNQTISGQSNAIGDTITCDPGQLVYTSGGINYFLYVYENSSVNTTKNIQFVRQDFPDGIKWVCTSTTLCYAKQDGSSPTRFAYIAFDTRKNATVETEVWKASDNSFMHNDTYRAHVHQNVKGDIYVDYFGRLSQAYFRQNIDGSVYSISKENPIIYSSNYQNTYNIAEAILSNTNDYRLYNDTLNCTIVNNTIYLDPWSMVCDNRNNTSASEEYRKISIKDSVCKNMSITLDNSYSLRLPNPHAVSDNELILTTQENFLDAAAQYWMWTGNKQDELSAVQITNKASTIEPGTDQIIEKQLVPGLNIKNHGNGSKNIYAYVTACSSVKYYVTSNGSDERTALVRAISENGNDTIESTLATPSTGAVGILEGLNPQEVYEIEFYTSEKDMTLYALQFNAPIHMDILNQACDVQPTKIMKDGSVVILKGGAVYNLLGTKLL